MTTQYSGVNKTQREFKLIAVSLKEAALDSPSFRAQIENSDLQIANVEKWLIAIGSSLKKFPSYVQELETFSNSFLEHMVPPFLMDGAVDQEYTVRSLKLTVESFRELWGASLQALNVHSKETEILKTQLAGSILEYKTLRQQFDDCQQQYEKYSDAYAASPSTRDANVVAENYKQLCTIRANYIHESLLIVSSMIQLGRKLDSCLISLCSDLWDGKHKIAEKMNLSHTFKDNLKSMDRISAWNSYYSSAMDSFLSNLTSARNQIEDNLNRTLSKPIIVNDFNLALVNSRSLADINENNFEKHGYLFMKTYKNKSTRPTWVRRWATLKNGFFGFLVLSPSRTFVQETGKIGISLCTVRYAPDAGRRFCFELKTVESSFIFQAETIHDLKSWLKVFSNEKNRILTSYDSKFQDLCSQRFPPLLKEFACTSSYTADKDMTQTTIATKEGRKRTSGQLARYIEKNKATFQKYVYYEIPQIRPPCITENTKTSIIAYSLIASNNLPKALTANIWGSLNWGLYYLHNTSELDSKVVSPLYVDKKNFESIGSECGIAFEKDYPPKLIPFDIQLRALFETAVGQGEVCLFSFSSVWMPSKSLTLNGRAFVTNKALYVYIQTFGFVSLYKGPLEDYISIECSLGIDYDILALHTIRGKVELRIFVGEALLMKRNFEYLLENQAKDNPDDLVKMLTSLKSIEDEYYREKSRVSNANHSTGELPATDMSKSFTPLVSYKVDYSATSGRKYSNVLDIPASALFHILLGEKSSILNGGNEFTEVIEVIRCPWYKQNGQLMRKFIVPVKNSISRGNIYVEQHIEHQEENNYYNFTHEVSGFNMLGICKFGVVYRFVIVSYSETQCKLLVFSNFKFISNNLFCKLQIIFLYRNFVNYGHYVDSSIKRASSKLGTHGQNVKAALLFGKLKIGNMLQDVKIEDANLHLNQYFICSYICQKVFRFIGQFFLNLFLVFVLFIKKVKSIIKINWLLLLLLCSSSLMNVFLLGKSARNYWLASSAAQVAEKNIESTSNTLKRAIYIKDYEDMLNNFYNNSADGNSSKCYEGYKKLSQGRYETGFSINYDHYGTTETKRFGIKLDNIFSDIAVKRNELILELTMLNSMEEGIRKSEWKNWLNSEIAKCDYFKENVYEALLTNSTDDSFSEVREGVKAVVDYCSNCASDLSGLSLI